MITYYLGKTVTVLLGAPGDDDFIATADTLIPGDVIRGGSGTNTLTLQGAGTFNLNVFFQIVNVQHVAVQEGAGQTVYLRNGLDLEVDAASPDPSNPGGGITIHGARNADVIKLGSGNDTVYLGDARESVYGGGGNDAVYVTGTTIGATIDGGTGTTTLHVTGGGTATMGANITDIAQVVLEDAPAGQTQPDYVFTANAIQGLTITASSGNNTITLGGIGQTVTVGAGQDTLIGATAGGDTFKGTAGGLSGDTIQNFAAAGDVIDVTDVASSVAQVSYAGTPAGGTLTVTDGTHTARITLTGEFVSGAFHLVSDGNNGTLVTVNGAPVITAPNSVTVGVGRPGAVSGVNISESPTIGGETFTVVLADTNGVLSANTGATGGGGTIAPSNGGTALTIAGTLAQVNADLTTLADNEPSTGADTITVNANDSNGGTASPTSIAVTAKPGFVIDPTFGSGITPEIQGVINHAISIYEADFTNPITVDITFKSVVTGEPGETDTEPVNTSYAKFYKALADATTSSDAQALARLAVDGSGTNNPVTNNSTINVDSADLRALGLPSPGYGPGTGTPDGTITLNTSGNTSSLLATTEHEIDEALGLQSALPNEGTTIPDNDPLPEDLFRFDKYPPSDGSAASQDGTRSFTLSNTATADFSINGVTDLAQFNNTADGGDFGDWQSNPLPAGVPPKVQDESGDPSVAPQLGIELTALDVIGYDLVLTTVTWNGATADWYTASDWSSETVPVANNEVVISSGDVSLQNGDFGIAVDSITLDSTGILDILVDKI